MKPLRHLIILLWRKRIQVLVFSSLFILLFSNTLHEEYPDEYDSLLGGRYIAEGRVPYSDWFQHHQPGAYALASIIYKFSGQSFVLYRYGLAVSWFLLAMISYAIVTSRLKRNSRSWFTAFLLLWAISATYFWGHMLLADSLAAILLVVPFSLLIAKTYYKEELETLDIAIISISCFLAWYTSMTTMFLIGALLLFTFYTWIKTIKKPIRKQVKTIGFVLLLLLLPYLLFFIQLILTNSFSEWIFANITYNSKYYIYNYPRPYGTPINPLRYSIVIAFNFFTKYIPALSGVSGMQFWDPLVSTYVASGSLFMIYMWLKGFRSLSFLILFLTVYANARSSPDVLKQTDYQVLMYIMLSSVSGLFLLSVIVDEFKKEKKDQVIRVFEYICLVLLGSYWLFTSLFFVQKYIEKMYPKYMGTLPLIYDRPEVAPIVNKLVDKNEYAWIGPFEFKELFFMKAKVPTRYHWFLDHAKAATPISTGLVEDFQNHQTKLIVFRRDYTPWGGNSQEFNKFFTDYLDKHYTRLYEYNDKNPDIHYEWTLSPTQHFNFDGTFHLRNENFQELVDKLIEIGAVKKVEMTKTQ